MQRVLTKTDRQASSVEHMSLLMTGLEQQNRVALRTRWGYNLVQFWLTGAKEEYPATVKIFPPESVRTPPEDVQRELTHFAQDSAVQALWQRNRIIYDVDPTVWQALGTTDEKTVIPAGLMRKLPHPDPFISFPEPIRLPITNGQAIRVGGFFVNGRSDAGPMGQTLVSTHSPRATGNLGLLFGGVVEDAVSGEKVQTPDGEQDFLWTRVTLDLADGDVTVGELITRISSRFDSMATGANFEHTVPALVKAAVSALIYLCAVNAEIGKTTYLARPPAKRLMGGKAAVIPVGYQIGAAIRKAMAEVRDSYGSGTPTDRRQPRPHIRRSHFHTYRVGPNREGREVKWLAPIPINVPEEGMPVTTVVPVR